MFTALQLILAQEEGSTDIVDGALNKALTWIRLAAIVLFVIMGLKILVKKDGGAGSILSFAMIALVAGVVIYAPQTVLEIASSVVTSLFGK